MKLTTSLAQGRVPVTILHVQGDLDASSYKELIDKGQEIYQAGARDVLLDLGDLSYISSSGLVALHTIALLLRGGKPADPESGWDAFHAIDRDRDAGLQQHVKLLNPQPKVDKVLGIAGFKQFFEVHTDLAAAIASF
jgi:anti-anti-sigma regulatory factor